MLHVLEGDANSQLKFRPIYKPAESGRSTICLLLATSFYMCSNGMSAALPQIVASFPNNSVAQVQMMMMSPGIITALTAFVQKPILAHCSRQRLVKIGLVLYLIAGLGGWFYHQSLAVLTFWNGIMGLATGGLIAPMAASILSETPEPRYRARLLGLWSASLNLGGATIGLLGGWLSSVWSWQSCFAINLLALPVLLTCILFLPTNKSAKELPHNPKVAQKHVKISTGHFFQVACLSFLFSLLYFVALPNISLFVCEQGFINPLLAGIGTACLMFGGGIAGLLHGRLFALLGRLTLVLGCCLLGTGYLCLVLLGHLPAFFLFGILLVGMSHGFTIPFLTHAVSEMDLGNWQTQGITIIGTALPASASFLSPLLFTQLGTVFGIVLAWQRFFASAISALLLVALLTFRKIIRGDWNIFSKQ